MKSTYRDKLLTNVSKRPFDAVLIVGPGHYGFSYDLVIKKYEESGLNYIIIGDGNRHITYDEIKKELSGRIDQNTRIDIWGHGCVNKSGVHEIDIHKKNDALDYQKFGISGETTYELIKFLKSHCYNTLLQNKFTSMHAHVWSCYAGAVRNSFRSYDCGIRLTLHSGKKYCSLIAMNSLGIASQVSLHKIHKHPYQALVHSFSVFPETVIYLEAKNNKINWFKSSAPKNRFFKTEAGIDQHINNQYNNFSKYFDCSGMNSVNPDSYRKFSNVYRNMGFVMESARKDSNKKFNYMKQYLDSGVSPDACIPLAKTTALHVATQLGDKRTVEFMLKAGADINKLDCDGESPSMFMKVIVNKSLQRFINPVIASAQSVNRPWSDVVRFGAGKGYGV